MSYYITTDATCDLPQKFYEENFKVIPMSYTLEGMEYGITNFLTPEEFYIKLDNGSVATTALVNTFFAKEFFTPILKSGKDILHICFSSGLSGSYQNLVLAVEELKKEFPNRLIYLIDSKCACCGEGLLVYYSLKARKEGLSLEDNYKFTLKMSQNICHYFTVDDLHFLHRGGRLSKAQAIFGTILKIKPVLYCNAEGKLQNIDKVVSRKKSLVALVDKFEKKNTSDEQLVLIGHAKCVKDAEYLKEKLLERFPKLNVEITDIGPVIGSHSGPGTVAFFFVGSDRVEANDESLKQ